MQQQTHSLKFLHRRKFLLVAPALVIPFITFFFWVLGGGKGTGAAVADLHPHQGLNLQLPDANFKKDKFTDKLGYYEKAAADSAKMRELIKNDPYINNFKIKTATSDTATVTADRFKPYADRSSLNTSPYSGNKHDDPNEAKVYEKLDELHKALNEATSGQALKDKTDSWSEQRDSDASGLHQMMQQLNAGSGPDSSMQQINTVLEKVLDLQYPERMRDKIQQQSALHKDRAFAVSLPDYKATISLLDTGDDHQHNAGAGFFSIDNPGTATTQQNAIEAVVHETQTLVNGAVVKMRLLSDVCINGQLIPKGSFIFGIATLHHERLEISINAVRNNQSLLPVKLDVYDMDGLRGIYIPGSITRDVAKQSSDNTLQSIALSSLNPSIGTQAASAGIETAKNLLSKKIKIIRVQVKAGYKVLLKDNNLQQ